MRETRQTGQFIVFAHARSGSTSLVRAMQEHPDLRILVEPFNETFTKWRPGAKEYRTLVTDTSSLDSHLDEMFAEHTGVKVLDYQMPRPIYTHMLRHPARKVIWLRRRNLLQSVVSVLISEQTGVWHAWDLDAPLDERYADLRPLSISDIRKRIGDLRAEIEYYDDVIESRPEGSFLKLTYEDLYLKGADERDRQLGRVFAFLGVEPPPRTETVMDPQRTKLNSSRTYALLPNADEIQEAVGSDETGWLFS